MIDTDLMSNKPILDDNVFFQTIRNFEKKTTRPYGTIPTKFPTRERPLQYKFNNFPRL